ncbi:MAG: lactate racemase domain-containing protein [bacterium]|nr:lactate racemase domain-containing protein [bacterium]
MNTYPNMATVTQQFPRPTVGALDEAVHAALAGAFPSGERFFGKRIAVAVGSRGITGIAAITKTVVAFLRDHGAHPFLIPAMGSHGGGAEEGQRKLLAEYGVTPEAIGVPLDTDLTTVCLGETPEGFPVYFSRVAMESDGVLLINRVKPHTDFRGEVESGLCKMITIGLGKIDGANAMHSRITHWNHDQIILPITRLALQTAPIVGGLAVVENAYHETALVEFVLPANFEERDKALLAQARTLMPSLPVEQADVLLIDQIGKNISGAGMDPNIAGRWFRINSIWQDKPNFTRICVLGLTAETEGNAVGIGLADFCNRRVVDAMDRDITYLNAVISRNTVNAHLPMVFDTDRAMMAMVTQSMGAGITPETMRIVRIPNTLDITRIQVSEPLIDELKIHPQVASISVPEAMVFDAMGNLPFLQ